jgi:Tfp pilus assembly protein PilX
MKLIQSSNGIKGARTIKNEKGYTLILVMIIITVIFILAMTLTSMAISTRLQFNKTDEQNKATDLAEMGITYFQTTVKKLITAADNAAKINDTSFCSEFKNLNDQNKTTQTAFKSVDGQNGYQITINSSSSVDECNTNNIFTILFKSKGITQKGDFEIINGTITLSNGSIVGNDAPNEEEYTESENGSFQESINSTGKIYYEDPVKENRTYTIFNSSAWFDSLTLNGQGSFLFKHDVIFDYFSMNNPTELTVEGNAIFLNPNHIDKKTRKAEICIRGNIYTITNNKLVKFTNYDDYFTNICPNSNSDWDIDTEDGMTIQY